MIARFLISTLRGWQCEIEHKAYYQIWLYLWVIADKRLWADGIALWIASEVTEIIIYGPRIQHVKYAFHFKVIFLKGAIGSPSLICCYAPSFYCYAPLLSANPNQA
jgi:hypothetical protein